MVNQLAWHIPTPYLIPELADGNVETLRANVIAKNLFAQLDDDGQRFQLLDEITYGLKSFGAAYRSFLTEHIYKLGFKPSRADSDCWMRPATKPNGFEYYEYMLVYVDDILVASHDPKLIIEGIKLGLN